LDDDVAFRSDFVMDLLKDLFTSSRLTLLVSGMDVTDGSPFLKAGICRFGNFVRLFREVGVHRFGHEGSCLSHRNDNFVLR
jgi:hypothetical protein